MGQNTCIPPSPGESERCEIFVSVCDYQDVVRL